MKSISLRLRLTLLLAAATLVALGLAAWVVDWRADAEMQQRFDASLLAGAQAQAEVLRFGNSAADAPSVFPGETGTGLYEARCGATLLMRSAQAPPPLAADKAPRFADAPDGGRLLRVVALRFARAHGTDACTLRYALDRDPLDDILRTLDLILLGSIFGACALVLLSTPWLVRRGLRPLAVLDRAMAEIGPDAPGRRLPAAATRELSPLVVRFNEVLARMDEGLARERQFAAGMAHELRTRLAELRALVEVEARYPSGRDAPALLAEIGKIGGELESAVGALLLLTRIESGLEQARRERVALSPLLMRALARHQDAFAARTLSWRREAGDEAQHVEADPALLEIVLDNLLGNAAAYAPAGSAIALRFDARALDITNAAPALAPADLAHFGRRFWRKDEGGGAHAGLGLALAHAAARAMAMRLDFSLDGGTLHATLSWALS